MQLPKFSAFQYRIIATGLVSALMLMVFIYLGLSLRNQAASEIYRETQNTARLLLTHFEEEIVDIDTRLQHVARLVEDIDLDDASSPDKEKQLHERLKYFSGNATSGPGIYNKHGLVIASGEFYPVPRLQHGDRTNFRIHADNPNQSKLDISPSVIGLINKQWSIHLTRPLRNKSGEFAGVVLMAYKLSNISDLYHKLQLTNHGSMALNGTDGLTRIRIRKEEFQYSNPPQARQLALPRIKNGEMEGSFHRMAALDGVVRIGSFIVSDKLPIYVVTSYDDQYFHNQYAGAWAFLAMTWLAITGVMFSTMIAIARFDRLRQQSEVKIAYAAGAAVASERQKLLADVHDSIGASLTGLLSQMNQGAPDINTIKRKVIETLTELRLLADTSQEIDGDLGLALASVRHRMAGTIERSGIALHWQVAELPKIAQFTSRDELALKLILLEAISNILHHASAKNITIEAKHDRGAAVIVICVIDDGRGFNPSSISSHGIGNMRSRAKMISIRTRLAILSTPGKGTTVRIEMTAPSLVEGDS